jgi:hypothetical protein
MTDDAIDCVEQMAATKYQPFIQSAGLLVEWRPNETYDDDDDPDYVYTPEEDEYIKDDYSRAYASSDDLTFSTDNLSV